MHLKVLANPNSTSVHYKFTMAKGDKQRKKSNFKLGHRGYTQNSNKGTSPDQEDGSSEQKEVISLRLPKNVYDSVTKPSPDGLILDTDAEGNPSRARLLRPTSPKNQHPHSSHLSDELSDETSTYRVFHLDKTATLFNSSFKSHQKSSPSCKGDLTWDLQAETKWGLGWSERLKCTDCNFVSAKQNMYQEVNTRKRGRKPADINLGVQVGLLKTPIGNESLRQILMASNIPAPCISSMAKASHSVGTKVVQTNQTDMSVIRQDLRKLNILRGKRDPSTIAVEGDGRYNNPLYSGGGKTPFQPATQLTYTMSENETPRKQTIAVFTGNKLCHKGSLLRSQGNQIECPYHEGCTANLPMSSSIGDEHLAAKKCVEQLKTDKEPLQVRYFTSDGDSRAHEGIIDAQEGTESFNLRDIRHFGESQRKKIAKVQFSRGIFPWAKTTAEREKLQKRLAWDICNRCKAEFRGAFKQLNGDLQKIKRALSYVPDCIIACYQGDCFNCQKYSYACAGLKGDHWKRTYLPDDAPPLSLSPQDVDQLRQCITYRLDSQGAHMTRLNTTTQKSESLNRVFSLTNPRTVTCSRNFPARIHSAVHKTNRGIAMSVMTEAKDVGAPIRSSRVVKQLHQQSERGIYHRTRQSQTGYKMQRQHRRRNLYKLHDNLDTKDKLIPTYKKHLLDRKLKLQKCDHCYGKPSVFKH